MMKLINEQVKLKFVENMIVEFSFCQFHISCVSSSSFIFKLSAGINITFAKEYCLFCRWCSFICMDVDGLWFCIAHVDGFCCFHFVLWSAIMPVREFDESSAFDIRHIWIQIGLQNGFAFLCNAELIVSNIFPACGIHFNFGWRFVFERTED